jgi:hypothetical protein
MCVTMETGLPFQLSLYPFTTRFSDRISCLSPTGKNVNVSGQESRRSTAWYLANDSGEPHLLAPVYLDFGYPGDEEFARFANSRLTWLIVAA